MKQFKNLVALVLAVMMTLALVGSVFAETDPTTTVTTATNKGAGNFTITIGGTYAEDNHTFKAYQIFAGSVDTTGKLGDIEWGNGVSTTGIDSALTAAGLATNNGKTGTELVNYDLSKAADVAAALACKTYTAAQLAAIADVFFAAKTSTVAGSTSTFTSNQYQITGLKAGYYLVTDEYTSPTEVGEGAATVSRNMMAVVGDVSATVKNDKPDIDKQVRNDNSSYVDANEAAIGETVAFRITGKVPNHVGYEYYYYVIQDTLSNGLTFNGVDTIQVKIGDTVLVKDADTGYAVKTGSASTDPTFQIAFKDIQKYTVGANIEVTYTATVNANAEVGSTGNPNTTNLIYSNDPNHDFNGTPTTPWPDDDSPVGIGPDHKTVTYVAKLILTKYFDSAADGNELEGATFTLTGTSTDVMGTTTDSFEQDNTNGNYYKLTDGTYTTQVPHGEIKDSNGNVVITSNENAYDSTTNKYKLTKVTTYNNVTKNVFMQGTSGADGKIVFNGLGAGTYTITETVTPQGYTTAAPITVTFTVTVPDTITTGAENATWASNNASVTVNGTTGVYEVDVIDLSGATLPSTGGIGTTIFYVAGIVLVLGAAAIIIARRKAEQE